MISKKGKPMKKNHAKDHKPESKTETETGPVVKGNKKQTANKITKNDLKNVYRGGTSLLLGVRGRN
jgi:hypothetical protein